MSDIHHLTTNILLVEFTADKLGIPVREMAEDEHLILLRRPYASKPSAQWQHGKAFFAALVIVTERDGDLSGAKSPHLHSIAIFRKDGVPTQHVRLGTMAAWPSRLRYTLRNISIASYAKTKGTPQTADQDLTIVAELVIGIGTAELIDSRTEQRQSGKSLPCDPSFVRRRGQECQHEKLEHGRVLRLALLNFKLMTLAVIGARVRLRCISWIL